MSKISRININQQNAEIGINSTPAKMHISYQMLRMRINNKPAEMQLERRDPSFKIDRATINSESGLKGPVEISKNMAAKGRRKALQAIKTIANDGRYLGNVKQRGNRVAQLSRSKTTQSAQKKLNIGLMPKSLPNIKWDTGETKINWKRHQLSIDWDGEYMPKIEIDPPYSIEVFLKTKPYFRLTVEEIEKPKLTGQVVDKIT